MPAIPSNSTATTDTPWDAGANKKRLKEGEAADYYRKEFAWVDGGTDGTKKGDYSFPHHEVSDAGDVGAANVKACSSIIAVIHGGRGGTKIPEADRKGVYDHAARHLKDAGETNVPAYQQAAEQSALTERFDSATPGEASVLPQTANSVDRTVDVVWYTGASVPRVNQNTGDPYNLRLDMAGCNLARLNAGAPIFDNHQSGDDRASYAAGIMGTKAQIGVVRKAWADGPAGKATLQFAKGDPTADMVWNKIAQGVIQNLSFGTWIYSMEPDTSGATPMDDPEDQSGTHEFVATNWEPFEISPVCVPADFKTAFLSAETLADATTTYTTATTVILQQPPITLPPQITSIQHFPEAKLSSDQPTVDTTPLPEKPQSITPAEPDIQRAIARKEPVMEQNLQAGTETRTEQLAAPLVTPTVDKEALKLEGVKAERERVQAIRAAAQPFASQLDEKFVNSLIDEGMSLEAARVKLLEQLAQKSNLDTTGKPFEPKPEIQITRDSTDTRRENMEASLLFKSDPQKFAHLTDKARDYVGYTLVDMARESLEAIGVKTRGVPAHKLASIAMNGRYGEAEYFEGARASTSDFPNILANVANKSLRMAYEAYPATFKPFCRMVTARDFKPLNRVQLSDIAALKALNEDGEFNRVVPSDQKETYSLATYGEIVSITRKVIINDDLQAFTRIPALLGVAAARLEADTVWNVLTANAAMSDTFNLFDNTNHSNALSGGPSALQLSALSTARATMRKQTAPKGTILNLVPMFLLVPAVLETTADQLVSPINIASTSATTVVPTWIRSLNPIVEPRLDANSSTAWYLVADPATIDTIEYAYLEGQQGVYTETRQGFEVDGVEIKARMDFAAAATEYRGLQRNAGT